ncbi:MAG: tryptophan halogenase [Pirellulaceae bacterium]|jgi:tryptophan halogenase
MNNLRRKIVIMGGGTAGASAVALLQEKLSHLAEIVLIDSADFPPVGVGEATVGNISGFVSACGLNPIHTCLGAARGTIKYAVRLKDWFKKGHSYFTPIGLMGMEYGDFLKYHRSEEEYWASWTGLRLGLQGKSPYLKREHFDRMPIPNIWPEYAYNIDATAFGRTLLDSALKKGATRIQKTIRDVVPADDDTVSHLILADGERIDADFFIDCSGFQRLIPTALQRRLTRFEEIPNDRAWVTRIPYLDRDLELPYLATPEAQTMAAGWRWQIGLKDQIGTGYVFSSSHISEDDALQEYMDSFADGRVNPDDCRLIKFETSCDQRQAGSNWITCGLSAGFVEPLESTSIFFMHNNLVAFLSLARQGQLPADVQMISVSDWDGALNSDGPNGWFDWGPRKIEMYNAYTYQTFRTTADYIAAHYAVSTLDHSDYWNDWRTYREQYLDVASQVLGYANENLFFSRPAYSLLSVGNQLGKINNWDLARLTVLPRQESSLRSGALSSPRAVLEDQTPVESLNIERDYLGVQMHRSYMADLFAEHALDLVDQHQILAHIDENSPDDW